MDVLLLITPVPGELYDTQIHINLPSMAHMISSCQYIWGSTYLHMDFHFPAPHNTRELP